jgi:hypothetical protein
MAETEELQNELQLYAARKNEWVESNAGEFVVIVGTDVVGFFPDYETGFKAGLKKVHGGNNFLVKQIWAEEPVYLIS